MRWWEHTQTVTIPIWMSLSSWLEHNSVNVTYSVTQYINIMFIRKRYIMIFYIYFCILQHVRLITQYVDYVTQYIGKNKRHHMGTPWPWRGPMQLPIWPNGRASHVWQPVLSKFLQEPSSNAHFIRTEAPTLPASTALHTSQAK